MNDQLLIGIVLIGIGILLAVMAYLFLGNRQPQGNHLTKETDQEQLDGEEPAAFNDVVEPEPAGSGTESKAEEPADIPQGDPADHSPERAATPPVSIPAKGERIQVAMLLRDEVSGNLIVKVDDVEYEDREALKDSRHWTRIEFAARDLSQWVEAREPKPTIQVTRDFEPPDLKPKSMIEQIDQILQDKIEASGRPDLAVRLKEGPGGTARVLIGVNSYEIADVPNPEIQALIREAVATWEATQ